MELVVKELANAIDEKNKSKHIRDFIVQYKDIVVRIMDVTMEKYNCIKLFKDARARANESGIELPKHAGFRYHSPNKENQRWRLNIDEDWVSPTKPHIRFRSRDVGIHTSPNLTLGTKPNPRTFTPKKPSSSGTSKCPPPFNPLPLAALGIDELLDFDVGYLCKEPEWEVEENEWDDGREVEIFIVGDHTKGGRVIITCFNDNPASDDDSQDKNFIGDDEETRHSNDSENVSLDDENNNSDSGDDEQLQVEVEQRI
ncbi:hypothetical protein Cgig2_015763 [Carnegiea gigantea]|uniref:Uncharacterized protein n=1 Tax=Carnegiea gigantea TaxID=171969 RepID=A0A9Q1KGU8_9CARY|nr:hypothetical protein Cgig2_015763 [Carnegiea gigantea]